MPPHLSAVGLLQVQYHITFIINNQTPCIQQVIDHLQWLKLSFFKLKIIDILLSSDDLLNSVVVSEIELPFGHEVLSNFTTVNLHVCYLAPKGVLQLLLQSQLYSKFWKISLILLVVEDKSRNIRALDCLVQRSDPIVVSKRWIAPVFHQRVNGLVVLVYYCQVQRCVTPIVFLVYVRPSKSEDLNEGVMVVDSCYLETVVTILGVDRCINWESFLEDTNDLLKVVGGDCSQEAMRERVRKFGLIVTVPCDINVEEAERTHHVGVGGIPGELGESIVPIKGKPLAGTEDGGDSEDLSLTKFRFQHKG